VVLWHYGACKPTRRRRKDVAGKGQEISGSRKWAEHGPLNPVAVCLRLMLASKITLALAQLGMTHAPLGAEQNPFLGK
jgi:hypothetical protein